MHEKTRERRKNYRESDERGIYLYYIRILILDAVLSKSLLFSLDSFFSPSFENRKINVNVKLKEEIVF